MASFTNSCTHSALFGATDDRPDGGEWATPQSFFDVLDAEFHFTLDVAASDENAKCQRYYTKADDGLTQPWDGVVFCNPPYGRALGKWLVKGRDAALHGSTVVFLIPARTDTRWFHEHVHNVADEIRFIKGRLNFEHKDGTHSRAPFPSMVAVYLPKVQP